MLKELAKQHILI